MGNFLEEKQNAGECCKQPRLLVTDLIQWHRQNHNDEEFVSSNFSLYSTVYIGVELNMKRTNFLIFWAAQMSLIFLVFY